jgi:fimbrial chaperone protein
MAAFTDTGRRPERTSRRMMVTMAVCLASALTSVATVDARGARVNVTPTSIVLRSASASGAVSIANTSDTSAAFQVTVLSWTGSDGGDVQLEPTSDMVVAPSVFQLAAGESRRVRVLSRRAPTVRESAYRLVVEQLPGTRQAAGISMLMRLSLPVFLRQGLAGARPTVSQVHADAEGLDIEVWNAGQGHLPPRAVTVRALSADGASLAETTSSAWYLLADERQRHRLALRAADCARVERISVLLEVEGKPLTIDHPHRPRAGTCGA